jgi:hypothetical protein
LTNLPARPFFLKYTARCEVSEGSARVGVETDIFLDFTLFELLNSIAVSFRDLPQEVIEGILRHFWIAAVTPITPVFEVQAGKGKIARFSDLIAIRCCEVEIAWLAEQRSELFGKVRHLQAASIQGKLELDVTKGLQFELLREDG